MSQLPDSVKQIVCEKHKIPYVDVDCSRCGGNGYTDSDIEEMDNPIAWDTSGNCWRCKGSGILKQWSCPECYEEYFLEESED